MQITEELKTLLLKAYSIGWHDAIAGDDVKSLDYQTKEQIIEHILEHENLDVEAFDKNIEKDTTSANLHWEMEE